MLRRCAAATAVALTVMTATVTLAPTTRAATVEQPGVENPSAASAVAALTADVPGAAAVLPADFADVLGYRPGTVDGLLVNPSGDCSSPVPLPAEFDTPCKAHDLGYDLLRYADRRGEPLGPWARQAIDATLDRRMQEACVARGDAFHRAGCFTMAAIADTVVDLNSRRQHYGTPVAESLFGAADSGVSGWLIGSIGLGVTGLATLLAFLLGSLRRGPGAQAATGTWRWSITPNSPRVAGARA
ncbi:hypothetical protein [Nocardia sp. NPDC050710]|uniref:hypothetical protein n=1 Tax=Nocardia sp. NPDC050710 TaxID=3157220 RepID=UPI0033E2BD78